MCEHNHYRPDGEGNLTGHEYYKWLHHVGGYLARVSRTNVTQWRRKRFLRDTHRLGIAPSDAARFLRLGERCG